LVAHAYRAKQEFNGAEDVKGHADLVFVEFFVKLAFSDREYVVRAAKVSAFLGLAK
jgi:hypothetical protein